MKALILAAGLGSRLRPFSNATPKPLFPLNGKPLLDRMIRQLIAAGVDAIIVNTHHRHGQIETFLAKHTYPVPVATRYEPELLGTGGAIKNVSDFWDKRPFIVINGDIVTDIDLRAVYTFHRRHTEDVTLVMHDHHDFNQVPVDDDNNVIAFRNTAGPGLKNSQRILAFTGIHVLAPDILAAIPAGSFVDIIDVYQNHLVAGLKIKACIVQNHYWRDIGTPQAYRRTVIDHLAPRAFQAAGIDTANNGVKTDKLAGDGSDRTWYRIGQPGRSIIMVDHGLRKRHRTTEADAFVAIGKHLKACGLPVPQIYQAEPFCGLVFMEDLGDEHLQSVVAQSDSPEKITAWYRQAIDTLITMSMCGYRNFDPAWTYQTPRYDKDLIIAKECRYFVDAFLIGYRELTVDIRTLAPEFNKLAERIETLACEGFMHRDLQSRNIMVKNGRLYFIDFQGGRIGPVQYDLASLLIDPYVALPVDLQIELQAYACHQICQKTAFDPDRFNEGYVYCQIARNLQMLGAFGFLTSRKHKARFEQYIPAALETLHRNLTAMDPQIFPRLTSVVDTLL